MQLDGGVADLIFLKKHGFLVKGEIELLIDALNDLCDLHFFDLSVLFLARFGQPLVSEAENLVLPFRVLTNSCRRVLHNLRCVGLNLLTNII